MMCSDLEDVLRGGVPREYGAAAGMGSYYACIAPSRLYDRLIKMRKRLG